MSTTAAVNLWGRMIGAVSLDPGSRHAAFQYTRAFAESGIQVAPLTMPLSHDIHVFRDLPAETFHGLPGLLADSLPDRFGTMLIDAWLATRGRRSADFNAIERLCYIGSRGMGALEFEPALGPNPRASIQLEVDALVELASQVLAERRDLNVSFADPDDESSLREILRVGTSAGGARAKAVIAWNEETNEVRSGQLDADAGFTPWLIKFDGVRGNRDRELDDPAGFGAIEYAYSMMAGAAGITMETCRIFEEHGRRHFMTRRFDRTEDGQRLHMQSLGAIAHADFNLAGGFSYEQAFRVIRDLGLSMDSIEEQFRRMAFNIVARNQDDHVKNIAFLMDRRGTWSLSPAFDLTYAYNPDGAWTAQHQMSMNGRRDHFTRADFAACGRTAGLKRGRSDAILDEVQAACRAWDRHASAAGVLDSHHAAISATLRLEIPQK